jgi:hypothetical protein
MAEPTKQELIDQLAQAQTLIAQQNETLAKSNEALERTNRMLAEQAEAIAALKDVQAKQVQTPAQPTPRPGIQARPYKGTVRAKVGCFVGDSLRAEGEVFHHEVNALWSDDPFEPVLATTDQRGEVFHQPHPEAPEPLPFHLRPRTDAALAAQMAIPRKASEW